MKPTCKAASTCMLFVAGCMVHVASLLYVACFTVRVINSRNPSEGTWNARWDLSEPEEASTGATDMSGSRVEVGDVGTCGSERDQ